MKPLVVSLVVTAFLVISWGAALGQAPLKLGFRGGVSISSLDFDSESVDLDSRTAFSGGGFLVIDLAGNWAIQTEVLYVPKGGKDKQMATDVDGVELGEFTTTFQINYLEIPVLVRAALGSSPVHVLAGPALAFNKSSKITASNVPGFGDIDEEWDGIAGTDIGLVFGVGVDLPVGFGEIVFDARYTLGLSNVNDTNGAEIKNRAFLISGGVAF